LAQLGDLLAPESRKLPQQPLLLRVELGRRTHVQVHVQVAAPVASQTRHPARPQPQRRPGLGARFDVDDLFAVQRLDRQPGAQRRRGHRHADSAVQVVALAGEDIVRPLVNLHVKIAGGATARAHLPLLRQTDAHAVLDARRNLDGQRAAGPDPAVAATGRAGVRDDRAVPLADRAWAGRDDLAEEGALDGLHLAAPATRLARGQVGAGGGSGAFTRVAEDRRVDSDRSLHTEGGLGEVELETKDRVSARTGPRTRPTGGTRGAEESVHDVLEADERPSVGPARRAATARRERVTAHVDDLPLSFVGEDLVRGVDLFELLLRFR